MKRKLMQNWEIDEELGNNDDQEPIVLKDKRKRKVRDRDSAYRNNPR